MPPPIRTRGRAHRADIKGIGLRAAPRGPRRLHCVPWGLFEARSRIPALGCAPSRPLAGRRGSALRLPRIGVFPGAGASDRGLPGTEIPAARAGPRPGPGRRRVTRPRVVGTSRRRLEGTGVRGARAGEALGLPAASLTTPSSPATRVPTEDASGSRPDDEPQPVRTGSGSCQSGVCDRTPSRCSLLGRELPQR